MFNRLRGLNTILFLALAFVIALTSLVQASVGESHPLANKDLLDNSTFYTGIEPVSNEQFNKLFNKQGHAIYIDFSSKFCLACKQMKPHLEKLLPSYPNIEQFQYDIAKRTPENQNIFDLFKPQVVPIQVFVSTRGEIVNVLYDYHDEEEIKANLDCINPNGDGKACQWLQEKYGKKKDPLSNFLTTAEKQTEKALESGSLVAIFFSFIAGVLTSFLPCTLSLLPILIGYLGAYAEDSKSRVFMQTLLFTLGLATVMSILGVTLSSLGLAFGSQHTPIIYGILGGFCILMACQMLGLFKLPLPSFVKGLPETKKGKWISFYLLGLAFGLVESPCGTPALAAILGIISKEGNIILGGACLFMYAVGQSVILIIAGLFTGFIKHRAKVMHISQTINTLSGILIIGIGLFFILQALGIISPNWALQGIDLLPKN